MKKLSRESSIEELDSYFYELETKLLLALQSGIGVIEAPYGTNVSIDIELIESSELGGENRKFLFARPKINANWRR